MYSLKFLWICTMSFFKYLSTINLLPASPVTSHPIFLPTSYVFCYYYLAPTSSDHMCMTMGLCTGAGATNQHPCPQRRVTLSHGSLLSLGSPPKSLEHWGPILISVGSLTSLVLFKSCLGNYSCCEVMCPKAISRLQISISQVSSLTSSAYILSALSLVMFLEPWMGEADGAKPSQ